MSSNEILYPNKDSISKLLTTENIPHLIVDHEPLLTNPLAIEYFSKNPPSVETSFI